MLKTTIADTRIKVRPSMELITLLRENASAITEVTENMAKILRRNGVDLITKIEILNEEKIKSPKIDMKLLTELCKNVDEVMVDDTSSVSSEPELDNKAGDKTETDSVEEPKINEDMCLYINDLRWLNSFLLKLRKDNGSDIYLHNIIEKCELILPQNEIIERNPELEARCQKLREQQQNLEYQKMTKNVDATLKNFPEDTIAYQMKALNKQIIAVLQFVFSVAAGFVFGFLGIELIIGNLDFGFRLLLGIICALVIALAEIYFLAKKLNEYDDVVTTSKIQTNALNKNQKPHND
ncbi:uncharacterized protein LOC119683446 [Teleopsis dalmanni]|uniref:uncharacterized protein LOC119679612 n=1 Tax=Teleopsis dalmanni TaxID=139649 RepID=UPI0018CDEB31|nr:uncharacterized protein LOC119679612 [Teleopsis dalmanni]XP_037953050.1 uncharacterized protein LOC119683446 [Teleopsis dalmanni]